MNNDGFPDLVTAASGSATGVLIHWGDGSGEFTAGETSQVGSESRDIDTLEVADVDGDGWEDIVVGYTPAPANADDDTPLSTKMIYYGSGSKATTGPGMEAWEDEQPKSLGSGGDKIGSLEIVDLNGDGNLDMVSSSAGKQTEVVLGKSVEQIFDEKAEENHKKAMEALRLSEEEGRINNIDVEVGDKINDPENSECRAPGDDYYPVRTTLYIDFPIVPCYSEECILLDPIHKVTETVQNLQGDGLLPLHRRRRRRLPRDQPGAEPAAADAADAVAASAERVAVAAAADDAAAVAAAADDAAAVAAAAAAAVAAAAVAVAGATASGHEVRRARGRLQGVQLPAHRCAARSRGRASPTARSRSPSTSETPK